MAPCERNIVKALLRAMAGRAAASRKEFESLAKEAKKSDSVTVRTFWTYDRICFTLIAIESVREGHRHGILIETWLAPLARYTEQRKVFRRSVRKFLRMNGIEVG